MKRNPIAVPIASILIAVFALLIFGTIQTFYPDNFLIRISAYLLFIIWASLTIKRVYEKNKIDPDGTKIGSFDFFPNIKSVFTRGTGKQKIVLVLLLLLNLIFFAPTIFSAVFFLLESIFVSPGGYLVAFSCLFTTNGIILSNISIISTGLYLEKILGLRKDRINTFIIIFALIILWALVTYPLIQFFGTR